MSRSVLVLIGAAVAGLAGLMGCADLDKLGQTQTPFNAPSPRNFDSHPTAAETASEQSAEQSVFAKESAQNSETAHTKGN